MKQLSPYCSKCKLAAVLVKQMKLCSECGIGYVEETVWQLSCKCGVGLMMPDIADKVVTLDETPLETILRRKEDEKEG